MNLVSDMAEGHPNARLETFCDGVFAIALTLLVLDIKIPASDAIGTTRELWLALYLLTDHAAPAVVIYNAVTVVQAVGWILVSGAALSGGLTRDEKSALVMRRNRRNGYFALVVYSLLALIALWFPLGIAIVTTLLWAYWLVLGLRAG